jgi:hypothetical protein
MTAVSANDAWGRGDCWGRRWMIAGEKGERGGGAEEE